jgi:hypothetical protein
MCIQFFIHHPLHPFLLPPSIPSRNYFALISNYADGFRYDENYTLKVSEAERD